MGIRIVNNDCLNIIDSGDVLPQSINLIVTSPPYANRRKKNYGGIDPDEYVSWFLPRAKVLQECLAFDGSFILNIKENVVSGERHTYVIDLILALREQGWLWTEEYIWHKKNSYPGKWPNRFRDAWERCLHFTLNKNFKMIQESVMVPASDNTKKRVSNLSGNDFRRFESQTNSGFGKKIQNWVGRDMVYPDNVLYVSAETRNKTHSAVFPRELPKWFIKLFTEEGDMVLDPFAGSGTTLVVCEELNRNGIGVEVSSDYCELIYRRLNENGREFRE